MSRQSLAGTSIYAKLAKVMSLIERVPKKGYNNFHKYAYTTEADLSESIRGLLAECGLAFFSSVEEQERSGEFTKVKMKFVLADTGSGETLESYYYGEGQDKGDKGLYKAYTGATKYFLMKTFLIPTGDDPEEDSETGGKPGNSPGAPSPSRNLKDNEDSRQVQHFDIAKARKTIFAIFSDIAKREETSSKTVQKVGKQKLYNIFKVDSLSKLTAEQWEKIINSKESLEDNMVKSIRKLKQEDLEKYIN